MKQEEKDRILESFPGGLGKALEEILGQLRNTQLDGLPLCGTT